MDHSTVISEIKTVFRRKDFVRARPKELPSIEGAVEQIKDYMKKANVDKVFIATDGIEGERKQLKELLGDSVFFYDPTPEEGIYNLSIFDTNKS